MEERLHVTVFHQPELALEVMRAYATKCDQRHNGERRCKSCAFLLRACDEIELLRKSRSTLESELREARADSERLLDEACKALDDFDLPSAAINLRTKYGRATPQEEA